MVKRCECLLTNCVHVHVHGHVNVNINDQVNVNVNVNVNDHVNDHVNVNDHRVVANGSTAPHHQGRTRTSPPPQIRGDVATDLHTRRVDRDLRRSAEARREQSAVGDVETAHVVM